jgi:hypothetical protein
VWLALRDAEIERRIRHRLIMPVTPCTGKQAPNLMPMFFAWGCFAKFFPGASLHRSFE